MEQCFERASDEVIGNESGNTKVEKLRMALHAKAKEEPEFRFFNCMTSCSESLQLCGASGRWPPPLESLVFAWWPPNTLWVFVACRNCGSCAQTCRAIAGVDADLSLARFSAARESAIVRTTLAHRSRRFYQVCAPHFCWDGKHWVMIESTHQCILRMTS